ncbi:hypothetical protein CTI14_47690, partial [Methylobacterium radiotolerans]
PRIEFRPLRPALLAGHTTTLTLLIRVHPAPTSGQTTRRPPLNLAFVIDRSGSMSGTPLPEWPARLQSAPQKPA